MGTGDIVARLLHVYFRAASLSSVAILTVLLLDLAGFLTVSWKFFNLTASWFSSRIWKNF